MSEFRFILMCIITPFIIFIPPISLFLPGSTLAINYASHPIWLLGEIFYLSYVTFRITMFSFHRIGAHNLSAYSITIAIGFPLIMLESLLFGFAEAYKQCGLSSAINASEKLDNFDYLYFSITTWTTTGYGDLAPKAECRGYAALEQMVGWVCSALLIAMIIGLVQRTQTGRSKADDVT